MPRAGSVSRLVQRVSLRPYRRGIGRDGEKTQLAPFSLADRVRTAWAIRANKIRCRGCDGGLIVHSICLSCVLVSRARGANLSPAARAGVPYPGRTAGESIPIGLGDLLRRAAFGAVEVFLPCVMGGHDADSLRMCRAVKPHQPAKLGAIFRPHEMPRLAAVELLIILRAVGDCAALQAVCPSAAGGRGVNSDPAPGRVSTRP